MLGQLILLGLHNPLFIAPTFKATRKCMKISTENFGRDHYKNGPANAFRHTLWNYLIAKKCQRWSSNQTKILNWTNKITEWHEAAFPNSELARAMDLHNNEVGRHLYQQHPSLSESKIIDKIKVLAAESTNIQNVSALKDLKSQLVHITET